MRRRWSARPERVSAHMDPDVDVRSPSGPGDRVSGTETAFEQLQLAVKPFLRELPIVQIVQSIESAETLDP